MEGYGSTKRLIEGPRRVKPVEHGSILNERLNVSFILVGRMSVSCEESGTDVFRDQYPENEVSGF